MITSKSFWKFVWNNLAVVQIFRFFTEDDSASIVSNRGWKVLSELPDESIVIDLDEKSDRQSFLRGDTPRKF